MANDTGAIFSATVSQNPPTGSLVDWRFKYRDPNAKGKGNVNCTDASDPRRNQADVCGASWSETVRDPYALLPLFRLTGIPACSRNAGPFQLGVALLERATFLVLGPIA